MTPEDIDRLRKGGDPYAFGVIPSKIDLRDHAMPPVAPGAVAPSFTHPSVGHVPVRNQSGSTCVGNSIATCLSLMEYQENKAVVPFNGELLNARVVGKQYGEWAAASPRDILQDVLDHGAAAFQGDQGINIFFPKGYAAVDHASVDAIKAALSTPQTTVTASFWLISTFYNATAKSGVVHDIPNEGQSGLHMITPVGYDDNGLLIQNSWGTYWGDGGLARLGWDYVAGRCNEMWAITDNPDASGGEQRVFVALTEAATGRAVRKGTSSAVYLLETGGRRWIQSLAMAKQMGVDLTKVQSLPPTDQAWNSPVIGPDAPMQYQG
jgi:hypothetical protein